MADELEIDENEGGEGDGPKTPADFAWRRKQEKAVKEALAQVDAVKRENAFIRAGIDPEAKGIAAYFVKGYDGEITTEAIQAAAIEAGVLQAAPPSPEQQQAVEAQQAAQRVAALGQGGEQAPAVEDVQAAALTEAYQKGGLEGLAAALASQGIPMQTA